MQNNPVILSEAKDLLFAFAIEKAKIKNRSFVFAQDDTYLLGPEARPEATPLEYTKNVILSTAKALRLTHMTFTVMSLNGCREPASSGWPGSASPAPVPGRIADPSTHRAAIS
jgi:hypothetical protein